MLEIAVCGGEKEEDAILEMLREICAEIKRECHAFVCRSPDELFGRGRKTDIGILDAAMPGYDGIELGRKLKRKFPKIALIYLTGHETYDRRIINQAHAFALLAKPVDRQELKEQIRECVQALSGEGGAPEIAFENVRDEKGGEIGRIRLRAADILYCEYVKSKREIAIVLEKKIYYQRAVFERLAGELEKYGFAVNCRGSIVNLRHISRLKGYGIYLDNGTELRLSQKRVGEFKRRMNTYIRKEREK